MDASRNKLPAARKKMRAQYSTWKKIAVAIADKQKELAAAKKKKPVDKNAVKTLESDIKAMHARAQSNRKAYNAAADDQIRAYETLHAVPDLFAK